MKAMNEELTFVLEVEEGWPPVATESLICSVSETNFQVEVPPFFIKDMSVGDVIRVDRNEKGEVVSWSHVVKSPNSTMWIMMIGEHSIEDSIECFKGLKCNVERLIEFNYFSIDIPVECPIRKLDRCLDALDVENVSIVFPSFRHIEPEAV
ncbi:MAG: DUF4265 domain-containing protein [Rhodanobacter sp.]